jgi:predicted nucleic acid-binding protein
MPVIDASVYVALVNAHESGHASSWAWFERSVMAGEEIMAPVILLAEVAAALGRGTGDPRLAQRVLQQLARSRLIELIPVSLPLAVQAAAIASTHGIRGCDAIYVALTEQTGDTLFTLDQQQLARGSAVVSTQEP